LRWLDSETEVIEKQHFTSPTSPIKFIDLPHLNSCQEKLYVVGVQMAK